MSRYADYVIARHYPACAQTGHRYRALLDVVVARQADLLARMDAQGADFTNTFRRLGEGQHG